MRSLFLGFLALCVAAILAGCRETTAPTAPVEVLLPPAYLTGVWRGTVREQPVVLRMDYAGRCGAQHCATYVAGGTGTVGADSVRLTGTLHGDTLRLATSPYDGQGEPPIALFAYVEWPAMRGEWTQSGTTGPFVLVSH